MKRKNRFNIWNGWQNYVMKNKKTVSTFTNCRIFAISNLSRLKQLLIIWILLLCCLASMAQNNDNTDKERVVFDGYVVAGDTSHPIRNTHVISKMAHCGTISNQEGQFHILARKVDTLWVSCIGYSRRLIPIDSTLMGKDLIIRLHPDTITLREVTILPFSNYETFKEMLITMPSIKTPDEIQRLYDDLNDLWLSNKPVGNGMVSVTASPIQYFYDKYNQSARRQATLRRNRRMYNEVLREQGRTDELLPDSLDFSVEYNESGEIKEIGKSKAMVPRKKYFRLGQ